MIGILLAVALQGAPQPVTEALAQRCRERGFLVENRTSLSLDCIGARVERERGVELQSLPFDGKSPRTRVHFTVTDEAGRKVRAEVFVTLGSGLTGGMRDVRVRALGEQIELMLAAVGAERSR